MNTTTMTRTAASRSLVDPINFVLNKTMTGVVRGLRALDKTLRERPARVSAEVAQLMRMADAYESTQPSYAADLRAAAMLATYRVVDRSR